MKAISYGMKDATTAGISRLVREAEDNGFVVLQRSGAAVALLIPLTLRGQEKMQAMYAKILADPELLEKKDPDLAAAARSFGAFLKKENESLREGVGSAEEQPTSARQGEGTGRRRKSPASRSKQLEPR